MMIIIIIIIIVASCCIFFCWGWLSCVFYCWRRMERVGWLQARGHRPVCGWSWTARPASPAGRVVILVALILLKECRQRKHPPKFAIVVSGGSWGLVALLWPA